VIKPTDDKKKGETDEMEKTEESHTLVVWKEK
jgi:hypothetical protein